VILDDISFAKRIHDCFKTHHIDRDEQLSVLPLSYISHNTKTRSRLSVGCNKQNYSIIMTFRSYVTFICQHTNLKLKTDLQKSVLFFCITFFYSRSRAVMGLTWYVPESCREFRRCLRHVTDTLTSARWAGEWSAPVLDVASRSSVSESPTVMMMMMMTMTPVYYRASCRTLTPTRLNNNNNNNNLRLLESRLETYRSTNTETQSTSCHAGQHKYKYRHAGQV